MRVVVRGAIFAIVSLVASGVAPARDYLYSVIDTPDDGEIYLTGLHGCISDGRKMLWVISPWHDLNDLLCYEYSDGDVILHRRRGGEYRRFPESAIEYQWRSDPCLKCDESDEELEVGG